MQSTTTHHWGLPITSRNPSLIPANHPLWNHRRFKGQVSWAPSPTPRPSVIVFKLPPCLVVETVVNLIWQTVWSLYVLCSGCGLGARPQIIVDYTLWLLVPINMYIYMYQSFVLLLMSFWGDGGGVGEYIIKTGNQLLGAGYHYATSIGDFWDAGGSRYNSLFCCGSERGLTCYWIVHIGLSQHYWWKRKKDRPKVSKWQCVPSDSCLKIAVQ